MQKCYAMGTGNTKSKSTFNTDVTTPLKFFQKKQMFLATVNKYVTVWIKLNM